MNGMDMMRKIITASVENCAEAQHIRESAVKRPNGRMAIPTRQRRLPRFFRAALATTSALALAQAIAMMAPRDAMGADYSWKGGTAKDWEVNTNWTPTGVPGTSASDNVRIEQPLSNDVILGVNGAVTTTINNFAMADSGASGGQGQLTIQNGSQLTINGSTTIGKNINSTTLIYIRTGSALISKGDASFGGTVGGGTVEVNGAGANWQILGANGLFVGNNGGIGRLLKVDNEGEVNVKVDLWLANTANSLGIMDIANGKVQVGRDMQFGVGGTATATVGGGSDSATLEVTNIAYVGNTSSGKLTVDSNGHVTVNNNFHIGYQAGGQGEVIIQNGGIVTAKLATSLIRNGGASAKLTVTGAGSTLETSALQRFGTAGTAQATFNGGTLKALAASTSFISGFTGNELSIGANGMTIDTNNFAVATAATGNEIGGTGALTVTDSSTTKRGNLTLNGANTFVGLTVNGGTATAGSATAFGGINGILTVNDGGTAAINSNNMTLAGLQNTTTAGGTVTLGSGTLTLNQADDRTFAGAITGAGALTKTGAGKLTLTGTSSTGALNVSGGTVAIDSGGSVTVNTLFLARGTATNDGTVNVEGAGSSLTVGATGNTGINLTVGEFGIGELNVTNDAIVTNNGDTVVGNRAGSSGTLNINSGGQMTTTGTAYISG
ncbi:beta strand repeat-containing protein, partial [Brucella endophytica]